MRALNEEQNRDFFLPGDQAPYSTAELAMFRQMTGYNLLQVGGGYVFVDDSGRPAVSSDRQMVEAAWEMFDLTKGIQAIETPGGEITIEGLKTLGETLRRHLGDDAGLYQHLIDMLTEMGKVTDHAIKNPDTLLGGDHAKERMSTNEPT
ncbi:hypothetical protein [Agrobacterium sp. NPDC089420]|uniref:hypothetical protein n=1 Tax=Agrobacterium sp. NPDC089420 TaxID=3363918 RepID=UPI00384E57EE